VSGGADFIVNVTSHTVGGESLCGHANNSEVKELISRKFDFVVLQDQSQTPAVPAMRSKTIECLKQFYGPNLIKAGSPNVLLYQTWGRRAGDGTNFKDFLSMQKALIEGYKLYSDTLSAMNGPKILTAPAGEGFMKVHRDSSPNPLDPASLFYRLYVDDGSHPTAIGSYIAACGLYMRASGKTPVGLKYFPSGVTQQESQIIQKIVAESLY